MTNNDILRRIRYNFDYNDDQMIKIFSLGAYETTREEVSGWLRKEDHESYKSLHDKYFAIFLNGLINLKRGKQDEVQPKPENKLNNNLILRKLKIAMNYRDEDIVELLQLADLKVSKHEINAFFRKPDQKQYRECKDQFLRNFLFGMQLKLRPSSAPNDELH